MVLQREHSDVNQDEAVKLVEDLKDLAKAMGKNQAQVARLLDVGKARVSTWFSGKSVPSLRNGLKIQQLISQMREEYERQNRQTAKSGTSPFTRRNSGITAEIHQSQNA